jgi:hypothetical protein
VFLSLMLALGDRCHRDYFTWIINDPNEPMKEGERKIKFYLFAHFHQLGA